MFEEGFRADLIVDGVVLVELKSVENLAAVHGKQVLTYLRLPAHCEWPAILCVFVASRLRVKNTQMRIMPF